MLLATKEKKFILLVDDDPEILDSLKEVISLNFGKDVVVVLAKDGVEGTTKINYQKFDCIITDLAMPRKEGEPFIQSVRHNNLNENTPIIVLSGSPEIESIAQNYEFIDTIKKPYKLTDVSEKLKVHLKMGGNKNRLSATVLNNLIDGVDIFVKQIMDSGVNQNGAVSVKRRGEHVEFAKVASIEFNIGKVKNVYSIMVDEKDLEVLREKCSLDQELDRIMQSMSYVIMKHVMGASGLLKNNKFAANRISHEKSNLMKKQGLVIQLGNDDFSINILATTG